MCIRDRRKAGRLTAQARALAGSMIRPGVTTHEIDTAVRRFIESHGAKPVSYTHLDVYKRQI